MLGALDSFATEDDTKHHVCVLAQKFLTYYHHTLQSQKRSSRVIYLYIYIYIYRVVYVLYASRCDVCF